VQNKKAHEQVTTVTPESPGIPRAMVLTVSFVLSPVIGLSCHRHRCDAKHHHLLDASVEAFRTTRLRRPPQAPSSSAPSASTASRPAFVTIASRPSGGRDERAIEMILSKAKAEYFSQEGWTLICPTGGLDLARHSGA
jgi:hypothetical protein